MILRDSVNATLIPHDTPVVAGYGDGRWIWSPSWLDGTNWWDLFPAAVQLVIAVSAVDEGDVLDVERFDATPDEAPGWCNRFHRPRRRAPTLYCNRDTWPLVVAALEAAGIDPAGPRIDWWISTLDGSQTVVVPVGAKQPVAIQFVDTGAYDESVILDPTWIRRSPAMLIVNTPSFGVWLLSGAAYTHITDPASLQSFAAANLPSVTVTDGEHSELVAGSTSALVAALKAVAKPSGTFTLTGSGQLS